MAERWISEAINVVGKQIAAIVSDDYESFQKYFTQKIRNEELTPILFKKARELYKKRPLVIEAIDLETCEVLSEDEVELKMVNTGRTLCHLKKVKDRWYVDDIYWDITIELPEDVIYELEHPEGDSEGDEMNEDESPDLPSLDEENVESTENLEEIDETEEMEEIKSNEDEIEEYSESEKENIQESPNEPELEEE